MKKLLILWDPENPLVPARPVVEALRSLPDLRVMSLTFGEVGHPSLPNHAFQLHPILRNDVPDGILWIEGGPLPEDLSRFPCPKACWLVNTHHEPSLLEDIGSEFGVKFSASIRDTADEKARWLPLASDLSNQGTPPAGLSLLVDDPKPPLHAEVEAALMAAAGDVDSPEIPVVLALGTAGQVHPMLFDCLRSGAALITDPDSDLRGIAHAGDHLEVYPSKDGIIGLVSELSKDPERLSRLSARSRAIADHLHQPGMRASRICQGLWPHHRVLSGLEFRPDISILVTCHRYLRRLRWCLRSLSLQELPLGSLEVVVADPGSPDGLAGALEEFAAAHPEIRLVHLPLDSRYHRNRGFGINRAFEVSAGEVIVSIDGDILFPPRLLAVLRDHVKESPKEVFGVRRVFLPRETTEQILAGNIDPFSQFKELAQIDGDGEEHPFVGVLGYCQAVHRAAFARARYPEEFDMVNQSDIVFVERLRTWSDVHPRILSDETVLHLWHPRNWAGATELL